MSEHTCENGACEWECEALLGRERIAELEEAEAANKPIARAFSQRIAELEARAESAERLLSMEIQRTTKQRERLIELEAERDRLREENAQLSEDNQWMLNAPLNSIWAKRIADAEAERDRLRDELKGLRHTLDEERKAMAKMMVRLDEKNAKWKEK